jgi:hypothetical protein
MNKVVDWLQILGNLGLVVGLVLVGFQLKQNSEILKTQVLMDESRRSVDQEWTIVGEEGARVWAKSIATPTELSLEEKRIMEAILWTVVENWLSVYRLDEQGLVEVDWESRISDESVFWFGNTYGRGWWDNWLVETSMPADITLLVSQQLDSNPDFTKKYFLGTEEAVKRRLKDRKLQ